MDMGRDAPDWDELFLSAALEPARWSAALQVLADSTGSRRAALAGYDRQFRQIFFVSSDPALQSPDRLGEHEIYSPGINYRVRAGARLSFGEIAHEAHYDSVVDELDSRIYLDLCARDDMPYGCNAGVHRFADVKVGMATLRSQLDGPSTAEQRVVFGRAAKAARRAIAMRQKLGEQQAQLLVDSLDSMQIAAFVIGRGGRVLASSAAAQVYLVQGSFALNDSRLELTACPDYLADALASLLQAGGETHLSLHVKGARGGLFMEAYRLTTRSWTGEFSPKVMLVVRQHPLRAQAAGEMMRAAYQLTAAESDVALALFNGESRTELACRRGVSAETLRSQIKSIYAKTGVDSEAGLMRRFARILG